MFEIGDMNLQRRQRIFAFLDSSQQKLAGDILMRGKFAALARDTLGQPILRTIIDKATTGRISNLYTWRGGRVEEMMQIIMHHRGCYVAQDIVVKYPTDAPPVKDLFEAILRIGVTQVAKNRHGSTVLDRLMEHCWDRNDDSPGHPMSRIKVELLLSLDDLCIHPYGNFWIPRLLTHASAPEDDFRRALMEGLGRNFVRMSMHWLGSQVLENIIVNQELRLTSLELGTMIGDARARVEELESISELEGNQRVRRVISAITQITIPITPPLPATPDYY